jgi:ABC-type nitrate/sulfonate/bicarbonate transport system ATPase subunit
MTALHIDIRSKRYTRSNPSKTGLVDQISHFRLDVAENEFVCIFGPSGCGKTTLLNIVSGLDRQFEGVIACENPSARFAHVFQNPRLLPWRTVRQNIDLAVPKATPGERVGHLLEETGIAAVQHQYPETLSLGVCRRAALVRAFASRPDFMLLDEPFVSLDAPTARRVRKLLIQLWRENPHGALFVTHDLAEAVTLADRLIFVSAAPMGIVADIRVTLSREMRDNSEQISVFIADIMTQNPHLQILI